MKNKITYPFRWICNPPAVNYFGDPSLAVPKSFQVDKGGSLSITSGSIK